MRACLAALLAWGLCGPAGAQRAPTASLPPDTARVAPASPAPVSEAQVDAAVARLRADPLLGGTRKERELRWKKSDEPPRPAEPATALPAWIRWLRDFGRWLSETSRVLVWALGAVVVAAGLVSARHLLRTRREAVRIAQDHAPSHVQSLDVRPQSLPEDIGAAAWGLWQAGAAHEALSLLYRGALSRLIHRHGVAVAASSTEGECLALARGAQPPLADAARGYFEALLAAWQAQTYGGRTLAPSQARDLCDGFGPGLDGAERGAAA